MKVELLARWSAIDDLAESWRDLLYRSRADCLFLTPEWIKAWYQAVKDVPIEPCLYHVTDGEGKTIGIAPLYRSFHYFLNTVSYQVLRVMGDFPTGAVYSSIIAEPGREDEVYAAVFEALEQVRFDGLWLPHTSTWTGAAEQFQKAADASRLYSDKRDHTLFFMMLPDTWDAYEQTLSKSTRKDFRRSRKKLIEQSGATIHRCLNEAELPCFLATLIDLNSKRWGGEAHQGVFVRKPREAAFYRAFAPVALKQGWLRFLQMNVDGRPIASEIGYSYRGRYYSMQAGVDPQAPPGSGKVLLNEMIRTVIEEGTEEFDFMTGDASYKSRYAAETRQTEDLFLLRKSLKSAPLRLSGIWPRGRYLDIANPRLHSAAK